MKLRKNNNLNQNMLSRDSPKRNFKDDQSSSGISILVVFINLLTKLSVELLHRLPLGSNLY